jgi:hypothetical protein
MKLTTGAELKYDVLSEEGRSLSTERMGSVESLELRLERRML